MHVKGAQRKLMFCFNRGGQRSKVSTVTMRSDGVGDPEQFYNDGKYYLRHM